MPPIPPASRYNGIAVGPRLDYNFEVQQGLPVDGTNGEARRVSPFTLRLRVPSFMQTSTGASNVLSFAAASVGSSNRSRNFANALAATKPTQSKRRASATLSDVNMALDVRAQLDAIRNAPPLTLLVNPAEMTITRDKIQSYQARTRKGYDFQVWGDQQPEISFSGSTAGFVAGVDNQYQALSLTDYDTVVPSGYQWSSRRNSAAWQNFSSLMHFYRSNGYVYDTLGKSEAHLMIGSVVITYDDWEYEGHINSLNFSFDEASPHKVTFDMAFTANRIVDLAPGQVSPTPLRSPNPTPIVTAQPAAVNPVGNVATPTLETSAPPLGN